MTFVAAPERVEQDRGQQRDLGTTSQVEDSAQPIDPEQREKSPDIPPEEGRKGWLCVTGSFIAIFCTFGFLNA